MPTDKNKINKNEKLIQVSGYNQGYICLMGKHIRPEKLQKKIKRKPRTFFIILSNFLIIIVLVLTIIFLMGI
jgi:hypothetical protein